jgi:single-strand DNA-binding protein
MRKFELIGNLGKKPEFRFTSTGKKVGSVNIATRGAKKGETEWFTISFWDKVAEIFEQYTDKGSKVFVEGEMKNRKYEKDGVTHYVIDLVVRNVELLSASNGTTGPTAAAEEATEPVVEPTEDEFPF